MKTLLQRPARRLAQLAEGVVAAGGRPAGSPWRTMLMKRLLGAEHSLDARRRVGPGAGGRPSARKAAIWFLDNASDRRPSSARAAAGWKDRGGEDEGQSGEERGAMGDCLRVVRQQLHADRVERQIAAFLLQREFSSCLIELQRLRARRCSSVAADNHRCAPSRSSCAIAMYPRSSVAVRKHRFSSIAFSSEISAFSRKKRPRRRMAQGRLLPFRSRPAQNVGVRACPGRLLFP